MTLDTPRKFTITSHLQTLNHPSTVPFPTSRAIITGYRDWGADTLGKEDLLGLPLLGKIWESGEKEVVIERARRGCLSLWPQICKHPSFGVKPRQSQDMKPAPSLPLKEVQGPRVVICRPHSSFWLGCFILFLLALHFMSLEMITWSLLWWLLQDTIEKKLFPPPLTP